MDEGYENERFEKLGIKTSVAKRFREFCKKMSKSPINDTAFDAGLF